MTDTRKQVEREIVKWLRAEANRHLVIAKLYLEQGVADQAARRVSASNHRERIAQAIERGEYRKDKPND